MIVEASARKSGIPVALSAIAYNSEVEDSTSPLPVAASGRGPERLACA
jgi:hypothetical protein